MPDMTRLVGAMKQAAVEAVEAAKPTGVYYGTVVSEEPLQIFTEQKLLLGRAQLVLARNVTDHWIAMRVHHVTELARCGFTGGKEVTHPGLPTDPPSPVAGGEEDICPQHHHEYKGIKHYFVLNALKEGEKVILIREQGGQKFVVIDRVEEDSG